MDRTGLSVTENNLITRIARLADQVNGDRDLRNTFKLPHEKYDRRVVYLRRTIAPVSKSDNLHLLVAVEAALVTADLNHTIRSIDAHAGPQMDSVHRSMLDLQNKTSKQLKELFAMLVLRAENPEMFHRYSAGTRARSKAGDFDKEGLPRDGIRCIMSSQSARLKNKEANAEHLSGSERDIIKIRRGNFTSAERLYKSMQRDSAVHAAFLCKSIKE